MAIQVVNNSNNVHNNIIPLIQGATAGSVAGLGLKYIYPLHRDEKNTKEYKGVVDGLKERQNSYNNWTKLYLDEVKNDGNKSVAKDEFLKTFDGLKNGDKVSNNRILKAFHAVLEKSPKEVNALKELFTDMKTEAAKMVKKSIEAYNVATKHFRPTGFFVGTGALAGAAIALVHNVLKTDVKD